GSKQDDSSKCSQCPNELGFSDVENFRKLFRVNESDRVDNDHRRQRGLRHQLNQRGKKEHCCQHDPGGNQLCELTARSCKSVHCGLACAATSGHGAKESAAHGCQASC